MQLENWHDWKDNVRTLLRTLAVALLAAGGAAWVVPLELTTAVWIVRVAAPVAAAGIACGLLFTAPPRKAPDLLASVTTVYFDRGGFCFTPRFVTDGGSCYLCLYFQNHFRGHATARIELRPPGLWFGLSGPVLAGADVSIECPGGAFGVAWMQYGVPRAQQGKHIVFRIAANVAYPLGPGERLLPSRGTHVGPLRGVRPGTSRAWIRLPTGVPDVGPAKVDVQVAILWQPDLPTGGFPVQPVLPVRSAA